MNTYRVNFEDGKSEIRYGEYLKFVSFDFFTGNGNSRGGVIIMGEESPCATYFLDSLASIDLMHEKAEVPSDGWTQVSASDWIKAEKAALTLELQVAQLRLQNGELLSANELLEGEKRDLLKEIEEMKASNEKVKSLCCDQIIAAYNRGYYAGKEGMTS